MSTEFVRDFDQRFKTMVVEVSFQMSNVLHKQWLIYTMLPYFCVLLMQQKILSQSEALELAMKLEDSLVGEIGAGMMQIQSQLANLMLQIRDIKKGK